MFIVTGEAGFVGSCVVHMMNEMWIRDIARVNHIYIRM